MLKIKQTKMLTVTCFTQSISILYFFHVIITPENVTFFLCLLLTPFFKMMGFFCNESYNITSISNIPQVLLFVIGSFFVQNLFDNHEMICIFYQSKGPFALLIFNADYLEFRIFGFLKKLLLLLCYPPALISHTL